MNRLSPPPYLVQLICSLFFLLLEGEQLSLLLLQELFLFSPPLSQLLDGMRLPLPLRSDQDRRPFLDYGQIILYREKSPNVKDFPAHFK